jgi:hypothetical protein
LQIQSPNSNLQRSKQIRANMLKAAKIDDSCVKISRQHFQIFIK